MALPAERIVKVARGQYKLSEGKPYKCKNCNHHIFDKNLKVILVSQVAPSNTTRENIVAQVEILVCEKCGQENTHKDMGL